MRVSLPEDVAASRSAADFYDYAIDGVPLRDRLKTAHIGVLSHSKNSSLGFARALLLETEGPRQLDGRVQLYGCRECLDIYCGGIATTVTRRGDTVCWEKIERFLVDYETVGDLAHPRFVFESIDAGPYEFDSGQYEKAFAQFIR